MRKEIIARNSENNMKLEQLRKSANQYSASEMLNEILRTQLHSVQQEVASERLQNKKERMQLEEKIDKLKNDIHNERAKWRRFEKEKPLNNTVIMKDSLNKAECDNKKCIQQMHELSSRLASVELEHKKCQGNCAESNAEVISLRTDNEKLKEACEMLRKENETRNDLEVQLLHAQENSRDLQTQLKQMERSLELADDEKCALVKTKKDAVEDKSLASDRILKLQEALENEKHRTQELEDKLNNATAQLEQHTLNRESRDIPCFTQGRTRSLNCVQTLGTAIRS